MHKEIRVLILEDEPPAIKRLTQMLAALPMTVKIVDCLDSVAHAVSYLKTFENMDLIISDIQLADGNSFEIFSQVEVKIPIIFATAYDEFMLQAFKVNSVDYLLKPYDQEDLESAITKYVGYHQNHVSHNQIAMEELISTLHKKKYKERFLVKKGKELAVIPIDQVAYFYSEDGYAHLVCENGSKYIVEFTLEHLKDILDPDCFFRINRKFYIRPECISKIHPYFNSRLKLDLTPTSKLDALVSREKVGAFKEWLDQ